MPIDGLTLRFMTRELNASLSGAKIEKITQPEKDTLLFFLHANGKKHRLLLCAAPSFARAHLTKAEYVNPLNAPMFLMLLRKHLGNARLQSVTQWEGDRVLIFTFDCLNELGDPVQKKLYLEIMGHHSNLTFVNEEGVIIDAARHVTWEMSRVRQALPGVHFELPPLQDKLDPFACSAQTLFERLQASELPLDKALQAALRGLSMQTAKELSFRISSSRQGPMAAAITEEDAEKLLLLLKRLDDNAQPQVLLDEQDQPIDLLPFPFYGLETSLQQACPTLSASADRVFSGRDREDRLRQKSLSLRKLIKNALDREDKKLSLQREEEAFGSKAETWRIYGEMLNAQLYLIPRGADRVTVSNFYDADGGTIEIPLDKTLTPAQNAQAWFKKYRKAMGAAETARKQIDRTLQNIRLLENALSDLELCENENDLSEVRLLLQETGYLKKEKETKGKRRDVPGHPLRFISPSGMTVEVGKNSIQNDRLTFSGRPGDIWLHAKDIPGSHVLIRTEGKKAQDADILFAAKLAAWYSSGRGNGVSVDYTDKKLVKKPGNAPKGFVTYTGEHALLIHCSKKEIDQMTLVGENSTSRQ